MENPALALAGILFLGTGARWLACRLHLPSILLLLIAEFLVGPVTGIVKPDELFGPLLLPFVSFSVAIILFEGAASLNLTELPPISAAPFATSLPLAPSLCGSSVPLQPASCSPSRCQLPCCRAQSLLSPDPPSSRRFFATYVQRGGQRSPCPPTRRCRRRVRVMRQRQRS